MTAEMKEREFYEKYALYQQLRAEADARLKQRDLVANTINEISLTISALGDIKNTEEGKEILVPLGSGVFIAAALKDNKKMLLDLGSDTYARKSLNEGAENLKGRNEELQKAMVSINMELASIEKQLAELSVEIERLSMNLKA
ncbi:MAG: prefoldin subunit alpha [Candidatus Aenigmarchaeota archaeon]|nr:prefoldin subunit alpha [Candidatus Aenigmarchaeota archaeon]